MNEIKENKIHRRRLCQTGKCLLIFTLLSCMSLAAYGQTGTYYYADRHIRWADESTAKDAKGVFRLSYLDTVRIVEIRGEWAKIQRDGKEAYLLAKYFKPVDFSSPNPIKIPAEKSGLHKKFFWWLLGFALFFIIIRRRCYFSDNGFVLFLFVMICLVELVYYFGFEFFGFQDWLLVRNNSPLWFCDLNFIGIWWGLLNSFAFAIFAMSQLALCCQVEEDLYNGAYMPGIVASIGLIILSNIMEWIDPYRTSDIQTVGMYVYLAVILLQAIFIIRDSGFKDALIYSICIIATTSIFCEISGFFSFFMRAMQ
jgi:hypothetical protein